MRPLLLRLYEERYPDGNYGLVILGGAALGLLSASAGHSFMVGVFTDAFIEELGISRAGVSSIWTATLVASSLYVNAVGRAADTFGAATVVRAAVLPYVVALLILSLASDVASLSAGYLLVRILGPETIDFGCRLCVNMWWVRRRGFAAGLINAVGALMVALPSLTSVLEAWLGWRRTLQVMGAVMGLGAALASGALLDAPERFGLAPDGEREAVLPVVAVGEGAEGDAEGGTEGGTEGGAEGGAKANTHEPNVSCAEAACSLDFWLLHFYQAAVLVPWNGINFHMAAVVRETGLGEAGSAGVPLAFVYLPLACGSFCAAVLYGVLVDYLPPHRKMCALVPPLVSIALCLAGVSHIRARWHVALFGAALGGFQGANSCALAVIPASLFGRRQLGSIQAAIYVSAQLASAGGATALGVAKDSLGSFRPLFAACSVVQCLLAAVVVARTGWLRVQGGVKVDNAST